MSEQNGNGVHHSPTQQVGGDGPEITLNDDQFLRLQEIVANEMSSRSAWLEQLMDPRRDIYKEAGYPDAHSFIEADEYQKLFDREPIPARVVELFPRETFQVQPSVYEVEDGDEPTPFEEAWDNLSRSLRAGAVGLDGKMPSSKKGRKKDDRVSWYQDEASSPIWEYLIRADVLSGIGRYGVILLGLADGGKLDQPATFKKDQKLVYLRVFPESLARITTVEQDETSPRFCHPTSYELTFTDPKQGQVTLGMSAITKNVHWTRVIHVADMHHSASSSEVFAIPRLQQVLNPCLGHQKVSCASPEMFWKGAFVGISLESPPGAPVRADRSRIRAEAENWQNSLQRVLVTTGLTVKSHAPIVSDPNPHLEPLIESICIKLGCPVRIFKGSERGELASSQDDAAWNDRIKGRQIGYVTPRVIVPFVDRLIQLGVLPEPEYVTNDEEIAAIETQQEEMDLASGKAAIRQEARGRVEEVAKKGPPKPTTNVYRTTRYRRVMVVNVETGEPEEKEVPVQGTTIKTEAGYSVWWPDLTSQNDLERADVAGKLVTAITEMVAKDGFSVMSEKDFWTKVMKYTDEEAQAIVDGAVEQVESDLQVEQQRIEEGLVPDPLAKEKLMLDAEKEGGDGGGGPPAFNQLLGNMEGCGAGAPGRPGFLPGNTCGADGGPGGGGSMPSDAELARAKVERFSAESLHGNHLRKITTADGRQFLFKPTQSSLMDAEEGAKREVMAASALRSMGVEAPSVRRAVVEGKVGVVSEWVDGTPLSARASRHGPASRTTPRDEVTRITLASFVIGATDRHPGNYMVDSRGRTVSIDHEFSFIPSSKLSTLQIFAEAVRDNGVMPKGDAKGFQFDQRVAMDVVEKSMQVVADLRAQGSTNTAASVQARADLLRSFVKDGVLTVAQLQGLAAGHR